MQGQGCGTLMDHIRTANGQTMLCNHCFIRRRVPTSIPPSQRQEEEPPQTQRRSADQGKPVRRDGHNS